MAKLGGTKGWLVLTGVAVLMTLAVVPALAGAASASPAPLTAANSPSNQWAYGGVGWSNGSVTNGVGEMTWNASFGWTVIFTETNTSAHTVEIEEQRTVGIELTATYSGPNLAATYSVLRARTRQRVREPDERLDGLRERRTGAGTRDRQRLDLDRGHDRGSNLGDAQRHHEVGESQRRGLGAHLGAVHPGARADPAELDGRHGVELHLVRQPVRQLEHHLDLGEQRL